MARGHRKCKIVLHVDSLFQNCHRSILTLQTKIIKHQTNYQKTIESLKKTHGKTSKKRLPFSEVSKESKRLSVCNSLLPEGANRENEENRNKNARLSF